MLFHHLLTLTTFSSWQAGLSWVEFFAGKAEASRMFEWAGHRTAKLDIEYMRDYNGPVNPMDLTTCPGMACLVLIFHIYEQ